MERVER